MSGKVHPDEIKDLGRYFFAITDEASLVHTADQVEKFGLKGCRPGHPEYGKPEQAVFNRLRAAADLVRGPYESPRTRL